MWLKLQKIPVNFYSFFRNIQMYNKKVSPWTSIKFLSYMRVSAPSPTSVIQIYAGTWQNWDMMTPFTLAFTVYATCPAVRNNRNWFLYRSVIQILSAWLCTDLKRQPLDYLPGVSDYGHWMKRKSQGKVVPPARI